MAKKPPKFVKAKVATGDQLEAIRKKMRELRSLQSEAAELEEAAKNKRADIRKLQIETLPELMQKANVDKLGLPAEGNLPPYDAKLKPFYAANIAAGWDETKRQDAFTALSKFGGGELIKTEIIIYLGRGESKKLPAIRKALKPLKLVMEVSQSVPHTSLTAFVREQIEVKKVTNLPLDKWGGTIGQVVELKPRKE